jgi:hypothetical protein
MITFVGHMSVTPAALTVCRLPQADQFPVGTERPVACLCRILRRELIAALQAREIWSSLNKTGIPPYRLAIGRCSKS